MTPEELGWDPTMKLYRKDGNHIIFSHELDFQGVVEGFKDSAYYYRTHWVMSIVGKTYVTIRALSLSRAEIMCGRGQLVWSAVNPEERTIAVIKHSWSPYTTRGPDIPSPRFEAAVYALTGKAGDTKDHCIGRVVAIQIYFGNRTLVDIRKGITSDPLPASETSKVATSHAEPQEQIIHQTITGVTNMFESALPLTDRGLCRMALKDYGYAIKRFLSLKELLQTLSECIDGYEFLLMNGIVHRDLSPANILICPVDIEAAQFEPEKVVGRLNDLDHAKVDMEYRKRLTGHEFSISSDLIEQMELDDLVELMANLQSYFNSFLLGKKFRNRIGLHPELSKAIIYYTLPEDPEGADDHADEASSYLRSIVKSFNKSQWKEIQERAANQESSQVTLDDFKIFGWQTMPDVFILETTTTQFS
ncbi:hypothetical protein K435DRAFT_880632 [Dendrothele bispora CBS 962.96]|uniref:Fungal-type protein kinase domain-containing protein n=1 Tax=Dendrothele bispora (strain CBS 962.96) TaxID=1314807 RepID=A0A4S8KJ81_DENBC|nr:hypothetical protein K435DRAFT_880632 [Dendrothele bispora CBS 962.96]